MNLKSLIVGGAILAVLTLPVSNAVAAPINIGFNGTYTLSDSADFDTFRESLVFSNGFDDHSGNIKTCNGGLIPSASCVDGLIGNDASFETVLLADLTLNPLSYVAGSYFDFAPDSYANGFQIFDTNGDQLLNATLEVSRLDIVDSAGSINSSFSMNLSSIVAGTGYTAGTSDIIEAFIAAPGGAANFTLQVDGDLSAQIINAGGNTTTVSNTYSGSAAPVPEPATIFLLGGGLLGLALVRRNKKS